MAFALSADGDDEVSFSGPKMKAVMYGSYFFDELLPLIDQAAPMRSDVVPEWHPECKYPYLLRLNKRFSSIDILHTDSMEGPIHDWHMAYILNRAPQVVLLNFGELELCNLSHSTYHVASAINQIARTLVSPEYGVQHVVCVGAILLHFGISCTPSQYRKRVYGMNTKLAQMCQTNIGFRFFSGFWNDSQGYKITADVYAKQSFIPGPEVDSPWFIKYVQGLMTSLTETSKAVIARGFGADSQ